MSAHIDLPIIILGFGPGEQQKLLAISSADGPRMLPVFTDPERAELYRRWQNDQLDLFTLPISASGGAPITRPHRELNTFAIATLQQASDILELVMVASHITMIALNPQGSEPCLCMDIEEFLEALGRV